MDSPITMPVADEVRDWQVGDLFTVGRSPEKKLIINVTDRYVEVIAETGWYNRYAHQPDMAITYVGRVLLQYDYRGRELLHRDFVAGAFTNSFNPSIQWITS